MFKARNALLLLTAVVLAAIALFYWTVNSAKSGSLVSEDIREATKKDFLNSIVLKKDHVVVILDGIANEMSFEDLPDSLGKFAGKLRQREVNIIGASDGDYKKIVNILDLMTIYKIPRFKMMRSELKSKDI
jgi:biopolymer transport protein ExbD